MSITTFQFQSAQRPRLLKTPEALSSLQKRRHIQNISILASLKNVLSFLFL